MKKIIAILILITPLISLAQDTERVIRKGLAAGKGTLAMGMPTDYEGTNMYVSGNLQYYVENNISLRGEIWFFLGSDGDKNLFKQNSTLFTNFNYHITTKNNIDPYIGIGPGFSWTQLKEPENPIIMIVVDNNRPTSSYSASLSPVASITAGINYYTKWAHLFIEAKYVHGIHLSDVPVVSLNELRIAFGFGWNINFKNKKNLKK
ncbi:MAG: hypothetical protein COA97_10165 [Flavobacteriales bacterium]|nr:MAG: hypothetical protein COA97_10165 [Flavobacteriales bacterium]